MASTALLIGVPLFILFLLARENVSGYADHSVDNVEHWKDFAEAIKRDRANWPARAIWNELGSRDPVDRPGYEVASMKDVVEMNKDTPRPPQPFPIKTLQDLFSQDDVSPAVGILRDSRYPHVVKRRQLLIRAINTVLSSPDFLDNMPYL